MTNRERAEKLLETDVSSHDEMCAFDKKCGCADIIELALDEAEKRGADKMRQEKTVLLPDGTIPEGSTLPPPGVPFKIEGKK